MVSRRGHPRLGFGTIGGWVYARLLFRVHTRRALRAALFLSIAAWLRCPPRLQQPSCAGPGLVVPGPRSTSCSVLERRDHGERSNLPPPLASLTYQTGEPCHERRPCYTNQRVRELCAGLSAQTSSAFSVRPPARVL